MDKMHPYGGGETEGMTGTSKGSTGAIGDERMLRTAQEKSEPPPDDETED